MSFTSKVSLIDLSKQFPFELDDKIKDDLCFAETLIISCGHCEGDIEEEEESESECSTFGDKELEKPIYGESVEVEDIVCEEEVEEEERDEDNYQFFFFGEPIIEPDSKTSVLIENGLPRINPVKRVPEKICTCKKTKSGECECFTKLPCKCGAKIKKNCTCHNLEGVCVCHEGEINVRCICKESQACLCYPEGYPRPVCKCVRVKKPCVCYPKKFASPVCKCGKKPIFFPKESEEPAPDPGPCLCQKPSPLPPCRCNKGGQCTCKENACICAINPDCLCSPSDEKQDICCDLELKCECAVPADCTCPDSTDECKCFSKKDCVCGNPDCCFCYKSCDCPLPCICDTQPVEEKACKCLDPRTEQKIPILCTCPVDKKKENRRLKQIATRKDGYRWCNEVDPKHTFFDYGYGRHHLIAYKEPSFIKTTILDAKDEPEQCPVHQIKAPPFKKKVGKPSLDCCSVVGGISINIETLGTERDKFLIQVVSHSSKEGAKTGSKLISIVDCNLHTMEENRSEQMTKKGITKEKRSYMAIGGSGYYNKLTRICGERSLIKRQYYTFEDAHNLILEGASLVLMRYFALKRYKGIIKTDTVMIGGEMCESIYVSLGVNQAVVNGKNMLVHRVERHIIEPGGDLHQTLTVLSLRGYIISQEWADNCYVIHINPLLEVDPQNDSIERHDPLREHWRDDMQLFSDFLDMKNKRTAEDGKMAVESGELTNTIKEYLGALLMLKPRDALHFTHHYFQSVLSSMDLPHDEYFDGCAKHVRYFYFED